MAIVWMTGSRAGPSVTATAAHLFGVIAAILMLVWLVHYRGGIDLDSDNLERVFNVHPFLAFIGFIFVAGEGMMAYNTVPASHKAQKMVHTTLNLFAVVMGIVAIYAVFKYHNLAHISDMYSLHSWLGMATICLFGFQWAFGFLSFWFPGARRPTRDAIVPLHAMFGVVIFVMAICTAEMGLVEKFIFSGLMHGHQAHLINVTGLMIFLYGIFVILTVISRMWVVVSRT